MSNALDTFISEMNELLPDGAVLRFGYRMGNKTYTFVALWVKSANRWYTSSAAPDRPSVLTMREMGAVLVNSEWVQVAQKWDEIR